MPRHMAIDSVASELIAETRPYCVEDPAKSRRLFWITVVVALGLFAVALSPLPRPVSWAASVLLGLTNVRIFIFFHDYLHGAIFKKDRLHGRLMKLYGLLILTPHRVWRDSHNYHHNHTSKIVGSSIGSYPILTVRMYRMATPWQRFKYRAVRHPLNMLFGYLTVFMLGMCIKPLFEQPKRYYLAAVSLLVHFGLLLGLGYSFGPEAAIRAYLAPLALSSAAGSYLFYAQHNYPGMTIYDRRDWSYGQAALHSSSMMTGGPLMRWFTGDIGFHHVHHLSSAIPFYRLEEAMKALPVLQNPGTTSFAPKHIWSCLRLALWDPVNGRMLSYKEAAAAGSSATSRPSHA